MTKRLILGLTFIFSSLLTFAQVPGNDLCADAIDIFCGDILTGSTVEATEIDEPTALCGIFNNGTAPGVWYSFAGTGDLVTVSLCGSDFDTQLQVFSGNCFSQVCVAGNDQNAAACGPGGSSQLVFESDASTNYLFYVNGFVAASGNFNIEITCVPPPPPPVNDECDFATPALVNLDDQCVILNPATLSGATGSAQDNDCVGNADNDVWFSFEALSETHIIEIQNVIGNPSDLVHVVYEGDCDNLVEISCSDPDVSTVAGLIIGDTYFIRIFTFGGNALTDVAFDLCIRLAPPPATNDFCADAITIACGDSLAGTTLDTTDTDEPAALCGVFSNGTAPGVWYSFTGIDGSVTVSLCGSDFDTQLQVFSGDCDTLTCVAGNDDNLPACGFGNNSELTFPSELGTNYLIYVNGFGANSGNFNIELTCLINPPAIDLICADPPFNDVFCYDNNNIIEQMFQGDSALPLRLIINSGTVEENSDEFIVLDSDGVTNLNPMTPYGNNGDLSGLVFTSTGNSISFLVQSDNLFSCATGDETAIDYTIGCLECTDPEVTYVAVANCAVSTDFEIEVTISDFGTSTMYNITDDQGNPTQNLGTPGTLIFGPYAELTSVTFNVEGDDSLCSQTSDVITFLCFPEGIGTADVDAGEDVMLTCDEPCVDLAATFIATGETTEYIVEEIPFAQPFPTTGGIDVSVDLDDVWSSVIELPFDFCFYGETYSQAILGSNAIISFNLTDNVPEGLCPWDFDDEIPSPNLPLASIFGPYMDVDPRLSDEAINYSVFGTIPNRVLVANFPGIPYFDPGDADCSGLFLTSQTVIYETTNVIEVYVLDRPEYCPTNLPALNRNAVLGIQNQDGTQALAPVDRNTGNWTASMEAYRFTPNGNINVDFAWLDEDGAILGNDPILNVCPNNLETTYTAQATYTNCNGDVVVVTDDVVVTRETDCVTFDCTNAQFFESFGQGTSPEDHAFLPAPYVFDGSGQLDPREYSVQNGLSPINGSWHQNLEDHTPDDTDGNALLINASDLPAEAEFYRRSMTVEPNTDYVFSIWVTTMYDTDSGLCPGIGDPTNFDYRFEDSAGITVIASNTGDIINESEFNWRRFFLEFNSGVNTTLDLVLENNEFGACGNDFAIDDIGLFFEGTPPDIVMPNDLIGCDDDEDGFTIYDLTVQNDNILNGLDPADFTITFYNTEDDAINMQDAIADPTMYTNMVDPEVIWVRVERENQSSCFSVTSFTIQIGPMVDLGITLPPLFEICSNEDFPAINGTVVNTSEVDETMVTYEWTDASGAVVWTEAIFVPTMAGVYTLEVFAPVCGTNVYTTEVTVFTSPILDLGMDESFCEGDDAFEIVPTITGDTTGITYLWSTGETTPTIIVDSTAVYTLTIMVDVCTVESSVAIEYLANPVVTLGADFQTCPEMDTTITATVDVEGDLAYEWLDPNGDIIVGETGSSIVIQIPAGTVGASVYTVNVLNGTCLGTDTIDISLYDIDNCIISQGVSPNGDGINDTLDLQFLNDRSGIEQFQIFNRHGLAVFTERDYVNQWGGQTDDGEVLPTGTYFYVILLENEDPEYGREASGWVYINREQ